MTAAAKDDPVVITGLGVRSPLGEELARFEARLFAPEPSVRPAPVAAFDASRYRVNLALEIRDPDPAGRGRVNRLAEAAAGAALADAGLHGGDGGGRVGVALATTAAGWRLGLELLRALDGQDEERAEELLQHADDLAKEAPLRHLYERFGADGPACLMSAACAAASSSIAWAREQLFRGEADVMVAGGVDPLTELVYAGFHSVRVLAPDACRPFSPRRRGMVLSEGAAFVVLERLSRARRRGVEPSLALLGCGWSSDAESMTTPDANGVERAMGAALANAHRAADDVGYVSAHATGTRANDAAEASAIARLVGERVGEVPVSAIKARVGHTQGVAGAFGLVAAALALRRGELPPRDDPERDPKLPPLCLDANGGGLSPRLALVNASGFGGANVCLAVGPLVRRAWRRPAGARGQGARDAHRLVLADAAVLSFEAADAELLEVAGGAAARPDDERTGCEPSVDVASAVGGLLAARGGEQANGGRGAGEVVGICLGTYYGSQAVHERMSAELDSTGPAGVSPYDFAVSTYNAPAGVASAEWKLTGPQTTLLGSNAGLASIAAAADIVRGGAAESVIAGGYDQVTPFLAQVLARGGVSGAPRSGLALFELRRAGETPDRPLATLAAYAAMGSAEPWPTAEEVAGAVRRVAPHAGRGEIAVVVIDGPERTRAAQEEGLAAALGEWARDLDTIVASEVVGERLAATAPLGLLLAIARLRREHDRAGPRGGGNAARPRALALSCGFCTGVAALTLEAS